MTWVVQESISDWVDGGEKVKFQCVEIKKKNPLKNKSCGFFFERESFSTNTPAFCNRVSSLPGKVFQIIVTLRLIRLDYSMHANKNVLFFVPLK